MIDMVHRNLEQTETPKQKSLYEGITRLDLELRLSGSYHDKHPGIIAQSLIIGFVANQRRALNKDNLEGLEKDVLMFATGSPTVLVDGGKTKYVLIQDFAYIKDYGNQPEPIRHLQYNLDVSSVNRR